MRHPIFILIFAVFLLGRISNAAEILPLGGEWRFALDRSDIGAKEKWFAKDLTDKIQLPGVLQAQGYGNDIATNTPWVLGLGDAWWNLQPKELREKFSQPGNVKVPFLSQPPKHYLDPAWYQRDLQIPTNWSGKHFKLFLERANWKTTVWLDEKEIGSNNSLSTPHAYNLGILAPGKHRLTICVDNRTQLPVAGHLLDSHSISDALGASWNGIVGKIELRATPPVWVEDVQVFVETSNNLVTAKIHLGNQTGKDANISLQTTLRLQDAKFNDFNKTRQVTVPASGCEVVSYHVLSPKATLWDEFHPGKESILITLDHGSQIEETSVSFGLREITAHDKNILINGKPVNLRTTHFGGDFPLTGHPAMDVNSWRKIIQTCKDYGLNGIRFHSWCPPEAAFEAADELGFYLQPECPLWADFGNAPTREFLELETTRILKAYGNHPSFVLFAPSNEPKNYSRYLPQWAKENYAKDNRRLYSAATGWSDPSQVNGGAQFATLVRYGKGQLRNSTGWFGNDYSEALTDVRIPVLSHEIGQWCAYPDFDVIRKFTGYLRPGNYEIFKHIADQNGVLEMNKAFAFASGKFQLACYKEEIEANLRTPGLAGFQLLDLHDYLGQGTALIGILDAFWESKGYVTPEEFRKFCAPVVPLAWLKKRVFTTEEKLEADIGLANFGGEILTNALICWEVRDAKGKVVGYCPSNSLSTIPVGYKGKRLDFNLSLNNLPAPAAYKLVARVNSLENEWNFWLYPPQINESKANDVIITRNWNEADKNLADDKKVLFLPKADDLDSAKCPPMRTVPVFWNIQMTVRPPQNPRPRFDAFLGLLCDTNHHALAGFPTDVFCDWQWTPLISNVRAINLTGAPRELKPIVWAIDDWNRNWKLGVIFECAVGKGKLLVSAINLESETGSAGLKSLRRSLLDYMGGEKFRPTTSLTPEQARALWAKSAANYQPEPARVFDPDLNDGSIPARK